MTQRVPYDEAVRMAATEGATVVLLDIQKLADQPGSCVATIELHKGMLRMAFKEEEPMTREAAFFHAEELAQKHGAIAIGVLEVGPAEQQD